jgi:hypothetical protein
MLTSFARQGVRQGPPSFVSLPSVYRTWGSPADSTARFTIPLPPNHSYTTADVRVFVSGVEQAIYIEELRGRHNDGTGGDGGARAFFVECDASAFTDADPAEIQLGNGTRGTTDLSASGRGSMAMLKTHFQNPRVVLCTDADYLCSAWVTFHPLVPESSIASDEVGWAVTQRKVMTAIVSNPSSGGTSNQYDYAWSAFSWWCQSGDPNDWRYASLAAQWWLVYSSPTTDGTSAGSIYLNPENIPGSLVWQPNETLSLMWRDHATAYLCTGYGQTWRNLHQMCVQTIASNYWNQTPSAIIGSQGARFVFGRLLTPVMYGALVDATYIMPTGTYAGGFPRRTPTWTTDLPKVLDIIDNCKYDTSAGSYRENYRGVRPTTDPSGELGNLPTSIGDQQTFQAAIPASAMIDYYLNVQADSRLPGWIKTNVAAALSSMVDDSGTFKAYYMWTRYPGEWRGATESPFDGGNFVAYSTVIKHGVVIDSTTFELQSSDSVFVDDELNGMEIAMQATSGSGIIESRTITDYVAATRRATLDATITQTGTRAYLVFRDTGASRVTISYNNAADMARAVQFVAALWPNEVVNGKTYEEWREVFVTQGQSIGENNRSVMGRWFSTQGTAFTVAGVPSGPSAIREPVTYTSA